MKFSELWLRSIVDPPLSSEALAHLLTMAGLEVEERERVAPAFERVVIGNVLRIDPHPQADRLRVCSVDTGNGVLQIVCGAPNTRVGMKVACALVGARLPKGTIDKAAVRGVESAGMLCSAAELGLADEHEGLLELSADAPLGADVRAHLELDDWVMTLKLTPNRGDCLSIRGLAREVAALTGAEPTWPALPIIAPRVAERREIHLLAGSACPLYCGRAIIDLDVAAPTPGWMSRRLERSGIRPISAVVDITNYVMIELGQPLHAFDLDRLTGSVRVRFGQRGERLLLLNGREVELDVTHLVIADDRVALALAGVMGGERSSVTASTRSVFLESAFFSPDVVARGARALELASDASHRFERGVDFAITAPAIERATELILEICGGQAGPVSATEGELPARPPIRLQNERVKRLLGIEIDTQQTIAALRRLGLEVVTEGDSQRVIPPSYRFDLTIEEDLIEEVARVHGYDAIAPSLPSAQLPMMPVAERKLDVQALKQALVDRDYFEVINFSFVDRQMEQDFAGCSSPVALANPIASQMSVMRSSLIGSLVECVRANVARKQDRVRIFEIAACFQRDGESYRQTDRVAGLCFGLAAPEQWGSAARPVDFFDVRGDLEALLGSRAARFLPATHPAFHPGQCARVQIDGAPAGWLGLLHPRWAQKYELPGAVIGFELDVEPLIALPLPRYESVSRFPPVRRDLAVLVEEDVQIEAVLATIQVAGGPLLAEAGLFDIYRGSGLPKGRKSLAFRVLLQDTEKTLTDVEVDRVVQNIVGDLQKNHGAMLRS